jgi:hypothetical protein
MPVVEDIPPQETDTLPFGNREKAGTLDNKDIDEASGLVASLRFPGYFWTHNDSGDDPRLFLIHESGKTVAQVSVSEAMNRDWEDISMIYDHDTQKSTLVIADIGDNRAQYGYVTLYMVEEPSNYITSDTTLKVSEKKTLIYPDGPRDAETLMVDPLTRDIFIISKREPEVSIYQIKYPYPLSDTIVPEKVYTLPLTQIVGGDISYDGSEIIIKNYDFVYYYTRLPNETVTDAFKKAPLSLRYVREPQGEAICFSHDKMYYYTLSEKSPLGITPVLYRYKRQ